MKEIKVYWLLLLVLLFLFPHSCKKEAITLPVVATAEVTEIFSASAVCGGEVTNNGGDQVLARGVCWSTESNPTLADNTTSNGTGDGVFTGLIIGLKMGVTYYYRAYAINKAGTGYGETLSFTTLTVDVDGNIYKIVQIGTQVWMVENLKTTKYNDGTPIPNITDNSAWLALTTGAYCDFANSPGNSTTYGRLYNWYAVDNNITTKVTSNGGKNVCPTDWHVPSDAEWTILTTYLGGESVAGGKLKETGTTHWHSPNTGATNETGFTALPGNYRFRGAFYGMGLQGGLWSSAIGAWYMHMDWVNTNILRYGGNKQDGWSVRCLRD